jgi:hypothetical protein
MKTLHIAIYHTLQAQSTTVRVSIFFNPLSFSGCALVFLNVANNCLPMGVQKRFVFSFAPYFKLAQIFDLSSKKTLILCALITDSTLPERCFAGVTKRSRLPPTESRGLGIPNGLKLTHNQSYGSKFGFLEPLTW